MQEQPPIMPQNAKVSKKKFLITTGILIVIIVSLSLLSIYLLINSTPKGLQQNSADNSKQGNPDQVSNDPNMTAAEKAGRQISSGSCTGTGPVKFTVSPMKPEDFSILIPYGLMVGGHVTPIDHQYFAPKDYNSKRDSYEVRAMADAHVTDIQARDRVSMTDPNDKFQEYRLVFVYSCTFFSYYDLVTSLSPELKAEYDKHKDKSQGNSPLDYPVKAGQVIGKIGGQTLDFAVWNTEKPLTGFIVPQHYTAESWKLYTANPYDYFSDELKALLIERNPRTVAPIEGKIDYDIDGKLIGTWFVEGTGGYNDNSRTHDYWSTHLAIAPDLYDPSSYIISIGNFNNEAKQFTPKDTASFEPKNIGVDSGLIKVSLTTFDHVDASGNKWNEMSLIKNPKVRANSTVAGCALFKMVEARKLKFEAIAGKTCEQVTDFSAAAKIYER